MKQEQMSLAEEAVDLDGQIESLNALKQKIMDDFKSPAKTKALREYSFTSSKFLVVFGLCTIAASLSSDSFGLFSGFLCRLCHRPHKPMHRINGLTSRASSIKSNLHNISDELERLTLFGFGFWPTWPRTSVMRSRNPQRLCRSA